MKKLLILGAGTAGTMVANRLARELDCDEWRITMVDQNETHYYQPRPEYTQRICLYSHCLCMVPLCSFDYDSTIT